MADEDGMGTISGLGIVCKDWLKLGTALEGIEGI